MATSQSSEPMGNVSRSFKTFARAVKKSDNHLLLSTTYGLNNSLTKKVVVGLGLHLNDKFEPVIRLISNSCGGICLKPSTWSKLADIFDLIDDYYAFDINDGSQWPLDNIDVDEHCRVFFTTAHNQRAIRFDVLNGPTDTARQESHADDGNQEQEEEDAQPPAAKKAKLFQPLIVMQKTTFEGLKTVYVCVDERLRRLERLNPDVNRCKDLYLNHVAAAVKRSPVKDYSLHRLAQAASKVYGAARETIAQAYPDPVFAKHYLDIVLLELTRLFPAYIAAGTKQLVEQERI